MWVREQEQSERKTEKIEGGKIENEKSMIKKEKTVKDKNKCKM